MRLKGFIVIFFISFFISVQASFSQAYSYTDQECLSCHGKPNIAQITSDGKVRSLFVDPEKWSQDIHQKGRLLCVDCHTLANPYFHFREGYIDVDCARCHPEEAEEYQKNIHQTFAAPSPGKELPLCFHCHTKHHVLRHDDPASSVHEENIEETCGSCHAEVMIKGVFKGGSLGKISGHRKGDISEKFDMRVCIRCHYQDSAHGAKRVVKDFCSRCHDVRSKRDGVLGLTHMALPRASRLNYANSALVLFSVIGICVFFGYRSRKNISSHVKSWLEKMRVEEDSQKEEKVEEKEMEIPEIESPPEQPQEEIDKEDAEQRQETVEGQKSEEEKEGLAGEEKVTKEGEEDAKQPPEEMPPEEPIEEKEKHQAQKPEEEQLAAEEHLEEETKEQEDDGDEEKNEKQ